MIAKCALWIAAIATLAGADEAERLLAETAPPARFAGQVAAFTIGERKVTFHHVAGERTATWYELRDRGLVVALVSDSGVIHLLTHDPAAATATVDLPRGRWHIDTHLGTLISTAGIIPGGLQSGDTGASATWSGVGEPELTLTRRFAGTRTVRAKEVAGGTPGADGRIAQRVESTTTATLRLDPVTGYTIAATFAIACDPPPRAQQYVNLMAHDIYALWPERTRRTRSVMTPVGVAGTVGWANNLLAIDLCDNDKPVFRDGGFGAYLDEDSLWSPLMTISGATARLDVCNAHADLDFVVQWPQLEPDADGLRRLVVRHRLLFLPPEATRALLASTPMRFAERTGAMIRVGRVETFDDQPLPLTGHDKGMVLTSGFALADEGRSSTKSLRVAGRVWPNLPQLRLEPDARYRFTGWYRLGAGATRAWVEARFYEWNPYDKKWLAEFRSDDAGPGDWQRITVTVDTPSWDPFIDLSFHCEGGEALLDDVEFVRIPRD